MSNELQTVNQETQVQTVSEASQMVSMIERMVMDPRVDAAKLEKLMDLQERAADRQNKQLFDQAMADLQANMPVIPEKGQIKDRSGKVQSTYARFEDMNDAMRAPMNAHGFSITFRHAYEGNFLLVTGVLAHVAGHREETTIRLPYDDSGSKNAVQGVGSSVSYGKRYCMASLLNITTRNEDDGGQKAVAPRYITTAQADTIKRALGTPENLQAFCTKQQLDHLGEIAAEDFDAAMRVANRMNPKAA